MIKINGRRKTYNLKIIRFNRSGLGLTSVTSPFFFWTITWWKRRRS